uniref:Lipopolysaccharide-induced TNF factor n=1 Tax=Suberites domuncula TaxID=55567 RepID=A7M868_SUBDO|nr:lipopolysaccharide-induced TNF factor [Suberites domuncula]
MAAPNAPPPAEIYPPVPQDQAAYPPVPQDQAAYPPPQPQQQPPPPQQQAAATTVVVTQPAVATAVVFRDVPVIITDSKGQQVQTQLEYRSGAMVFIIAAVIFILGFWCCCCIPFCIDSFKDVYHINPTDGSVAGVYKRI